MLRRGVQTDRSTLGRMGCQVLDGMSDPSVDAMDRSIVDPSGFFDRESIMSVFLRNC